MTFLSKHAIVRLGRCGNASLLTSCRSLSLMSSRVRSNDVTAVRWYDRVAFVRASSVLECRRHKSTGVINAAASSATEHEAGDNAQNQVHVQFRMRKITRLSVMFISICRQIRGPEALVDFTFRLNLVKIHQHRYTNCISHRSISIIVRTCRLFSTSDGNKNI